MPGRTARIVITYCTQCRWLLRASWLAQELLSTFADEITELALRPGRGGIFTVEISTVEISTVDISTGETGAELVWDRKVDGGFPELNALKRTVRDRIAPQRRLGHIDRVAETEA